MYYYHTNDKDGRLAYPHYSDKRFNSPASLWGKEEDGLQYEYSDRLEDWDYNAYKRASEEAENLEPAENKGLTARWIENYLTAYFGRELTLKYVLGGGGRGNRLAYYVYGFKFTDSE